MYSQEVIGITVANIAAARASVDAAHAAHDPNPDLDCNADCYAAYAEAENAEFVWLATQQRYPNG